MNWEECKIRKLVKEIETAKNLIKDINRLRGILLEKLK